MKLVDLTRPPDPDDIDRLLEKRREGAAVMVPDIEYQRRAFEGADAVCASFGCAREDLPDGEGWGAERLHINTHLGTHLDARFTTAPPAKAGPRAPSPTLPWTSFTSNLWDGHFAGPEKEILIVQQIHNLAGVPASGFKVGLFPLRLARCSASPARVVAFVP